MEFALYALTALISFLGVFVGGILAFISPEEMPTGKKYFPVLQAACVLAFAAFFSHFLGLPGALRFAIYLGVLAYAFFKQNTVIVYYLLGILLSFVSSDNNALLTLSMIAFIYGVASGSLYAAASKLPKIRAISKLLFIHSPFLFLSIFTEFFRNVF
ncbi:hypothetical protein JXB11_02690 [Candidatus Woesearchaeota archaeon]|nr:hypothetical protein [Candidatus Woesearchaeota archaeon]